MGLNRKGGSWKGGYVSLGPRRAKTYVIEKRISGQRFHVSTARSDEHSALKELDRFFTDPSTYEPAGRAGPALRPDGVLIEEHLTWHEKVRRNSPLYVDEVGRYLADWIEQLGAADWRKLSLTRDLKPALERMKTARPHRIAALKIFMRWLRTEKGLLTSAQDPTLDLEVPQANPEKLQRQKAVARPDVQAVLTKMSGRPRDYLLVLACTGWHTRELDRVARGDLAELVLLDEAATARTGALAVVRFLHKKKRVVAHPVRTRQMLDALLRLRSELGWWRRRTHLAIRAAVAAVNAERIEGELMADFSPGVMRHSFSTWHMDAGADINDVAADLDHQSPRTTAKFYVDVAVPKAKLPALSFELSETIH